MQQGEVFIKFFAGARDGFIANLGAELFTTYAVLATYMDRNGKCYPTQIQLAKALGVRRETVNARIKRLEAMTWEDEPIITVEKNRNEDTKKYANNIYTLNTKLAFRIFNDMKE